MRTFSLLSIGVLGAFCLSGCGTAIAPSVPGTTASATSSSTLPSPMPEQSANLRGELETIYNAARVSIDEATPDTYFTHVEEAAKDPAKVAEFKALWPEPQTKTMMKNFLFTDLATTEFIKVEQQGDWAGYYYLSDLQEKGRLTINIFRFHRINGKWMAYPRTSVSSVPFEGTTPAERTQAIETEIQESDSLKVVSPVENS